MTITSTTRKAGPFAGNDATVAFAFAFKVFSDEDLRVVQTDEDGVETDLVLDTDFSAVLNADQDSDPGGTVTVDTAPPTGETLTIISAVASTQETDLQNGGGFYPNVINAALDRVTILIQQLEERAARTLQAPVTDSDDALALPTAAARAGKVLVFDADGLPDAATYTIVSVAEGEIIGTPTPGSVVLASFAASVNLAGIAGLVGATDRLIYCSGASSYALATFTAFGRSLVDDADAATARTTLGLGTMATATAANYAALAGATFTGAVNLTYTTGGVAATEAGYRGLPVNTQDAAYSFVKNDLGRMVRHTDASARVWTIEPFATSAIPVGAAITVRNIGTGVVTLTRGAGVTLRIAGSATDANVALAQYGLATLVHEASNVWVVTGTGLS